MRAAVGDLLRRVPELWAEHDEDTLTATESQALSLLVAAGLVERRIRLRVWSPNHPTVAEATVAATGEYGFVEAMEPVVSAMWPEWAAAYRAWRTGETRTAPFGIVERLKPSEWRLTDEGVLARADLDGGHAERALDFVLRQGSFDGRPRLIPAAGRVVAREAVRGCGRLVTMRKVQTDALAPPAPLAVRVDNWPEGAGVLAATIRAMAEGLAVPAKPPAAPDAPTYTVAALRDMTGLENSALGRYAKRAGVKTPARGERDFKYTLADVRAILQTIIAHTAEDKLRDQCKTALRNLPEIAE